MANSVWIGWFGPVQGSSSGGGPTFSVPMSIGPLSITATAVTSTVPLVVPDGTTSAVSIQFGSANSGIYKTTTANMPALVSNGTVIAGWRSAGEGFILGSAQPLSWSSGTPGSAGADVVLSRGAAGRIDTTKSIRYTPVAFAALPTAAEGAVAWVNDSTTATWGATISGGGANKVLAVYNGTNWTVAGV